MWLSGLLVNIGAPCALLASSTCPAADYSQRWERAAAHLGNSLPAELEQNLVPPLADIIDIWGGTKIATELRAAGLQRFSCLTNHERNFLNQQAALENDAELSFALNRLTVGLENCVGLTGDARLSIFSSRSELLHYLNQVDCDSRLLGGAWLYFDTDGVHLVSNQQGLATTHTQSSASHSLPGNAVMRPRVFQRRYDVGDLRNFATVTLPGEHYQSVPPSHPIQLASGQLMRFGVLTVAHVDAITAVTRKPDEIFFGMSPIDVLLISGSQVIDDNALLPLIDRVQAQVIVKEPKVHGMKQIHYRPHQGTIGINTFSRQGGMISSGQTPVEKLARIQLVIARFIKSPVRETMEREFGNIIGLGAWNGVQRVVVDYIDDLERNPITSAEVRLDFLTCLHETLQSGLPPYYQRINARGFDLALKHWGVLDY